MMLVLLKIHLSQGTLNNERNYTRTTYDPHLEYAIHTWSPYTKGDKIVLENVQKRATRVAISIKDLIYQKRLHNLGLTALERRHE